MADNARELTSWKQIAAHLGINVRTAQKWEREHQMPVRRLPGGRVAATTEAVDRWHNRPRLPNHATAFRWPVDRDMIVEVRFIGGILTSAHVQRVVDYLNLVRTSLE